MSALANDDGDVTTSASGAAPHLSAREWLLLMVLAAVQFNHIVDFMIIMPLGPEYMEEMGLSPGAFGALVSAYTISAAVANVLAAFFVDRFDRKRALITAFAGFTAGTFLCAIAPDYLLLLAAHIVAGAFGGVAASLVMAIVGDAFHDSRRGFAMGVVMSAFSVASIFGLPLGLFLADQFGWQAPFAILATISAAVVVLAAVALPPLRGHLAQADGAATHTSTALADRLRDFVVLLADANHLRTFAVMTAMMFSGFLIGPYIPTFLTANLGMHRQNLKYVYLCGGLTTIMTVTPIGWLADRFGKLRVFRVMALATIIPLVWITLLPAGAALPLVLTVTTLQMVTMSGRMVPAMAMITSSAAPGQRGGFMSLNTAVQHMSAGLASAAGGALLAQPVPGGPLKGYSLIVLLCCVATVLSLYLAGRLRRAAEGALAPDALTGPATATSAASDAEGSAVEEDEPPTPERLAALEDG